MITRFANTSPSIVLRAMARSPVLVRTITYSPTRHLAHNVTLGDHIIMSNVGTLAGHVTVEDHAVIGGLVAIHQFCRIGKMSMIGGCSKIVQDVPPFMLVDGNRPNAHRQ